jgi:hypothetical protein
MSNCKKWMMVFGAGIFLIALIAVPVYAMAGACGMCTSEAKAIAEKMKSSGMTLTKAIEAAEKRSRATALTAFTEKADDKTVYVVYLVTDKKLILIEVDEEGKTGGIQDAENLPGLHDDVAHKPKPKPGA